MDRSTISTDERRLLLPSTSIKPSSTPSRFDALKAYFSQPIPQECAAIPLAIHCFITGAVAAVFINASSVWVPFMTGTLIQLVNSASYFLIPPSERTHLPVPTHVLERGVSLGMFVLGCFVSGRLPLGARTRGKLAGTALAQSLITLIMALMMAAGVWSVDGISVRTREFPTVVIGAAAFTMGIQATACAGFASPAFSTTVAFTASLVQMLALPFHPQTPLRALSFVALILGTGAGNLMTNLARSLLWIGLFELALAGTWTWAG